MIDHILSILIFFPAVAAVFGFMIQKIVFVLMVLQYL